jgi:hypothetical protein
VFSQRVYFENKSSSDIQSKKQTSKEGKKQDQSDSAM